MILFDNPILFIIVVVLIALSLASIIFASVAFGKYTELSRRYEMFMTGKDAESLEDYFIDLQKGVWGNAEFAKRHSPSYRR